MEVPMESGVEMKTLVLMRMLKVETKEEVRM
jgi:hypothetical protein